MFPFLTRSRVETGHHSPATPEGTDCVRLALHTRTCQQLIVESADASAYTHCVSAVGEELHKKQPPSLPKWRKGVSYASESEERGEAEG